MTLASPAPATMEPEPSTGRSLETRPTPRVRAGVDSWLTREYCGLRYVQVPRETPWNVAQRFWLVGVWPKIKQFDSCPLHKKENSLTLPNRNFRNCTLLHHTKGTFLTPFLTINITNKSMHFLFHFIFGPTYLSDGPTFFGQWGHWPHFVGTLAEPCPNPKTNPKP